MDFPWERPEGDWQPVSRVALIAWLVFYGLLLLQAARAQSGVYLLLDYANFFPHEGGHFFFSWFGETMAILGGTLGSCWCRFFWPSTSSGIARPRRWPSLFSGSSRISS